MLCIVYLHLEKKRKNIQQPDFPCGPPPQYQPVLAVLNFADRTGYGVLTVMWPYMLIGVGSLCVEAGQRRLVDGANVTAHCRALPWNGPRAGCGLAKKKAKKDGCPKKKKYTATGLPMWSPTIVLTGLDRA